MYLEYSLRHALFEFKPEIKHSYSKTEKSSLPKKLFMLTKQILSSKLRKKRTTWLKLNAVFSSRNLQVNEDKTTHITTTWRSKHQNMKGSQDGRFSARKLWGYHSKKTTRNIKYEQTSSSLDQKKSYKWRKSA